MSPNNEAPEEYFVVAAELWAAALRSPTRIDPATAATVARVAREWAELIERRAITARIWDRRSEPRERVMGQVLTNLEGFAETVALTKEKGA